MLIYSTALARVRVAPQGLGRQTYDVILQIESRDWYTRSSEALASSQAAGCSSERNTLLYRQVTCRYLLQTLYAPICLVCTCMLCAYMYHSPLNFVCNNYWWDLLLALYIDMSHEELKLKGNELFVTGKYDEAIDHYTEALKLQPQSHLVYSNRSACYNKLEKYQEALDDAVHCLSIAPNFARGHLRKATALNGLGRHDIAMRAAEEGYKLRGSDRICKDCVAQWLEASTKVLHEFLAEIDEVPPGVGTVSLGSVKILASIQSEHSKPSGVSTEFMEKCLLEVVTELELVLELFGHTIHSSAHAWVAALTQALKADPRTHMPATGVIEHLSIKTSAFTAYLSSDVDPILYPVICPIVGLAILSILACVSTLSRVISFRSVIQQLVKSCLQFFEKSILSGQPYIRLHIHALQLLLNSFCMESGHAKQCRDEERTEVLGFSKRLEGLLEQYTPTSPDYADVKQSTEEILENCSVLHELSPGNGSSQLTTGLTKADAEAVKADLAREQQALLMEGKSLNFRDMDSLVLSTGIEHADA